MGSFRVLDSKATLNKERKLRTLHEYFSCRLVCGSKNNEKSLYFIEKSSILIENYVPQNARYICVFTARPSSSRGGEGVGARERAPTVPSWSLAATPTANQRAPLQWGSRGTRGNRTTPATVQPHYVRYNIILRVSVRISFSCLPPGRSAPCT